MALVFGVITIFDKFCWFDEARLFVILYFLFFAKRFATRIIAEISRPGRSSFATYEVRFRKLRLVSRKCKCLDKSGTCLRYLSPSIVTALLLTQHDE